MSLHNMHDHGLISLDYVHILDLYFYRAAAIKKDRNRKPTYYVGFLVFVCFDCYISDIGVRKDIFLGMEWRIGNTRPELCQQVSRGCTRSRQVNYQIIIGCIMHYYKKSPLLVFPLLFPFWRNEFSLIYSDVNNSGENIAFGSYLQEKQVKSVI